jgi:hypothetical protein
MSINMGSSTEISSRRSIRYSDQTWRQLDKHFQALTFNPPLAELRRVSGKHNIIFLHIGKCAGESIIRAMAQSFGTRISCFEYHTFDANQVIRDLLLSEHILPSSKKLAFVIATRNPVKRWFSSFNWDLHDLVLSKGRAPTDGFRRFPKASDLAEGIATGDSEALNFAKTNHMGMGLSWYLPLDLVPRLSRHRFYEIRQEHADQDFARFIDDFSAFTGTATRLKISHWLRHRHLRAQLPRTKDQYKNAYLRGTFASPSDCDPHTLSKLREFLEGDYAVNAALRQLAIRQQTARVAWLPL